MDRLDAAAIAVPGVEVRVLEQCTSTNSLLLDDASRAPVLLAAESQTAGRGRRGRRWYGTPGHAIAFSLARAVRRPARELAALSLVAGVAAARALRAMGAPVRLKWPNDLLCGAGKLGGILVETRSILGEPRGVSRAVVGIGINHRVDPALPSRVRRPLASLAESLAPLPSRNEVIRSIATSLLSALDAFEAEGFDALRGEWLALDAYAGLRLRVRLADGRSLTGIAAGLAEDGGLRLQTRTGVRAVRSGTVRLAHAIERHAQDTRAA
ncbi:MAG TPA: biotin--[acetyl-CoA-carboxylase] ligase [Burkholderiales bacterium]|nr:biotin--[acetyl-CoA-carboxylase] ligase [Burkholderiales bacterium]